MTKEEQEHRDAMSLRQKCLTETKIQLTLTLKDNGCECNSPDCYAGVGPILVTHMEMLGVPRTLWPKIAATAVFGVNELIKQMAERLPEDYRKPFMSATMIETHALSGKDMMQVLENASGLLNPDGTKQPPSGNE